MVTQSLFTSYPKAEDTKRNYVAYPVQKKNTKWVAAYVTLGKEGGFISVEGDPTKREFDTEGECLKACGIHNTFNGYTREEVEAVVSVSMGLTKISDYPAKNTSKKKTGTVRAHAK